MLLLPEPVVVVGEPLSVVVVEEPLPLGAPGMGGVTLRSLERPDCTLSHLIRQRH
jgi:hypothetical protein